MIFFYLRFMKKFLFVVVLIVASCSGKDDQFCKCLEAGEALNNYSTELFNQEMDQSKADRLKELKNAKKEACANYQTMSGEEMLKRKKECGSEQ